MSFVQDIPEYKKIFCNIEKLSKTCVNLKCNINIYIHVNNIILILNLNVFNYKAAYIIE